MRVKNVHIGLFLNTGFKKSDADTHGAGSKAKWTRIKMQDSLEISYDAQTTEEKFIDDMSATTTTDSYNLSVEGELICSTSDAVFEYLDAMRKGRQVGEGAESEVMLVYLYDGEYDAETKAGSAPAEVNGCSIQFSKFSAEGAGGNATLGYTINFSGDPRTGTATVTYNEETQSGQATFSTEKYAKA